MKAEKKTAGTLAVGTHRRLMNKLAGAQRRALRKCAAEKLGAIVTVEHLRERTRHAKREDFENYLASSPDVLPLPGDEL